MLAKLSLGDSLENCLMPQNIYESRSVSQLYQTHTNETGVGGRKRKEAITLEKSTSNIKTS